MNISQIENNISDLIKRFSPDSFIYDFLASYGLPKSSISRLKKGGLNLSKNHGEVIWKKKLFYKVEHNFDLYQLFTEIKNDKNTFKHDPRFLIVTDLKILLALDTKTNDSLNISILELPKNFDFFLPLAGMEKAQQQEENPADVKAAEKMAKLYEQISKDNPAQSKEEVHYLNIFLTRILFCFFAEDTGIFEKGLFTKSITSHTQADGSDLNKYLDKLFLVLNADENERKNLSNYLTSFPYVNGGLFEKYCPSPNFNKKSRQSLIDIGDLDWSAIHPDIFGSMIQAVITPEHRGSLGMHYTSVPNIMKIIEPLFLNDLYDELESSKYDPRRLKSLLERISKIKIFDPACGSGNFLIIAYKELRKLEMRILQQLKTLQKVASGFEPVQLELIPKAQLTLAASYQQSMFSRIELSQFYGIELDDFACEVAILSLWLAKHQMNLKFKEVFGAANPILPLRGGGNIIYGNATRIEWESVCPKTNGDEVYILGNPPYLGSNLHSDEQREDMKRIFMEDNLDRLDYIGTWFFLAAKYLKNSEARSAFVTTNSITQGVQVPFLWKKIFDNKVFIHFAVKSFKWTNNAKGNAGVTVAIIGLSFKKCDKILLYDNNIVENVKFISPYLIKDVNVIIQPQPNPPRGFPPLVMGNKPSDDGNLILSEKEVDELVFAYPESKNYIKKFVSADDFINGNYRYCLWIEPNEEHEAKKIPLIKNRTDKLFHFRSGSKAKSTRDYAPFDYRFRQISYKQSHGIVIPTVSSERRKYIPLAYVDQNTVVSNATSIIYDANIWLFAVLHSRIHMAWVRAISGRLEERIRYSSQLCYNTFPFPSINNSQKQQLEILGYKILEEREKYSEKTLAQLYDPEKMPAGLREVHNELDLAVEKCYRSKLFENDEERLEFLLKQYEQVLDIQKSKGTLFEPEVSFKQKKKK